MRGKGYVGRGKRRGKGNWSFEEGEKKGMKERGEGWVRNRGKSKDGKKLKGEEMGSEEKDGKA